jgi:hypothetical protein
MRRCLIYEGLLKLVALVGFANLLLPCLWPTYPVHPTPDHADEDALVLLP